MIDTYILACMLKIMLAMWGPLTFPRYRTKWGTRDFVVAAPSTWNSLPVNLRTASTVTLFKKC